MLKKKFFKFEEVQQALRLESPNDDVKDMLKIVNHPLIPEPELFDGCPLLIIERAEKKDVFIVWKAFGIAVQRYSGRYVYWLLKFDPKEEFDPKRTIIISCGDETHPTGNLISYFRDVEKIISAIIYITNAYKAEQELKSRFYSDEKDVEHNKNSEKENEYVEDGEWRYDSAKGKDVWYPDWLGGMEAEEDFWEH